MKLDFPTRLKTRLAEAEKRLQSATLKHNRIEKVAWKAAVYELEWVKREMEI